MTAREVIVSLPLLVFEFDRTTLLMETLMKILRLPPVKRSKRFLTRNMVATLPFVTQLRQMDLILSKGGTQLTSE